MDINQIIEGGFSGGRVPWTSNMWDTCDKPTDERNYSYLPEWLEEREV